MLSALTYPLAGARILSRRRFCFYTILTKTVVGQYTSVKPRAVKFHEDVLCGSVVVACTDMGRLVIGTIEALSNGCAENHLKTEMLLLKTA